MIKTDYGNFSPKISGSYLRLWTQKHPSCIYKFVYSLKAKIDWKSCWPYIRANKLLILFCYLWTTQSHKFQELHILLMWKTKKIWICWLLTLFFATTLKKNSLWSTLFKISVNQLTLISQNINQTFMRTDCLEDTQVLSTQTEHYVTSQRMHLNDPSKVMYFILKQNTQTECYFLTAYTCNYVHNHQQLLQT